MLVCLPFWSYTDELVLGLSVVLLAMLYCCLLFIAMCQRPEPGTGKPTFFSVDGVLSLMRQPTAALAVWVHILAFDLMVGLYIRHKGALASISHWALLPCYVLTPMFGPRGLLAFLGLHWELALAV
jgi:hypothetical protein